jgi:hypothetical protein
VGDRAVGQLPQPLDALADPDEDAVDRVVLTGRRIGLAPGLLVGLLVEGGEPREHEGGVVLRREPQPALRRRGDLDRTGLPQPRALVDDQLTAAQPGRGAGQHLRTRQCTVGAPEVLAPLVQHLGERPGRVVRHRHRERRVGLERRGPHDRADDLTVGVAHDEPPALERRTDPGPRVVAVGQLPGGPLAHAGDDAPEHGVRGEQLAGRVEEGQWGVEELQLHGATLTTGRAGVILVFTGRRPVNRLGA